MLWLLCKGFFVPCATFKSIWEASGCKQPWALLPMPWNGQTWGSCWCWCPAVEVQPCTKPCQEAGSGRALSEGLWVGADLGLPSSVARGSGFAYSNAGTFNFGHYRRQTNQYFKKNTDAMVLGIWRECFSFFQGRLSCNKRKQPWISA